jgi:zinc D-Ala-D-Ala carboxypeptidase
MILSENFSLDELTKSQEAIRLGIDNIPDDEQVGNLILLCKNILQPIRNHFGKVVSVSSGYRSAALMRGHRIEQQESTYQGTSSRF